MNGDGFADIGVRTLSQTRTVDAGYDENGDYFYNGSVVVQEARFHIVLGRAAPDSDGDGRPERVDTTFYSYDYYYGGGSGERGVVEVFWGPVNGTYYGSNSLYQNVNIRGIGDINGDGFDDVAVSQPNINVSHNGETSVGYVDVFFGSADGPDPFAQADLRIVKTDATLDYLGTAITGLGDVNGDGIDDFAISAPDTFSIQIDGEYIVADGVFIIFGREGGPAIIDLDRIGQPGGEEIGYRIFSTDSTFFGRSQFGVEVAAAGDVNGDGFADILIGAPLADVESLAYGGNAAGKAFVVFGGPALEAADLADGVIDNVINVANIVVDLETGVLPIVLSVANAGFVGLSQNEGDSGATIFAFEVRRTGDLTEAVSFDFAVSGVSPGLDGADFVGGALPSGTASFASGAATTIVEITVQGDRDIESSELFAFTISNPVSETSPISVGASQTLARINNDDFPISFFANGATVNEGDTGDETVLSFLVQRTGPGFAASVDFSLTGDSFFPADAADFVSPFPVSGTLQFADGESEKRIELVVRGDEIIESTERVRLTLSNPESDGAPVQIGRSTAIGTIVNDDFAPEILVSGPSFVFEGNFESDNRGADIVIERRGDLTGDLVVTYMINPFPNLGNFLAIDQGDVEQPILTPHTVTIPDGQASATVRVDFVEDRVIEPNERFSLDIVAISQPDGGPTYSVIRSSHTVTIGNDDGRPPVIPPGVEADVFGDPHIVTLDGLGYDFQAVGEYILVETLPGAENPFQGQVRFEPLPGSQLVSVTTRMAVEIGGVTVEIDALGADTLLIGGVPATAQQLALGAIDVDGDGVADVFIDEETGMFFLVLNGADEQLAVKAIDGTLNVCVFLSSEEGGNAGNVRGLMGDGAGDGTADDLALRDGTVLDQPLAFDLLYGDFAASWRIDGKEDKAPLFSNTAEFPEGFPLGVITLDDLPADIRAAAEAAALAAGLDPENKAVFEGAVLDFALTGNQNLLNGAFGLVAESTETTAPVGAPALPVVVGVTVADPTEAFFEGDEGVQDAVFTFYRIGDAPGAVTISYVIEGDVDAADLAPGTAFSGQVTLGEGQDTASIAVGVAGDLLTEADERLTVRITGVEAELEGPAPLVAGPSATKIILTDDFAPEAVDDFFATDEDARVAGNLLAANPDEADSDADGDALTVVSVTSSTGVTRAVNEATGTGLFILASGAHLRVNADGSFTYDPFGFGDASSLTDFDSLDTGEIGVETFTYRIADGNGGFDDAAVTITVTGINDAPVAVIDNFALTEDDASVSFNVIAGSDGPDIDPEGGPLTVTEISGGGQTIAVDPLKGATLTLASGAALTVLADGTAIFFTNGAFEGLGDRPGQVQQRTVSFTYTVADEGGLTDSALLNVTVAGVNDAPEIDPIEAAFRADDSVQAVDLLAGATDAEGDDLFVQNVVVTGPDREPVGFSVEPGTGLITLDGAAFANLQEGETAVFAVAYEVSDGAAATANSATITVEGALVENTPPVAVDDDFSTGFGAALSVDAANGLLANDSDPDGDEIRVVSFQQAQNGDFAVFADGSFTYEPDAGFAGTETILYTITDGFAFATATLTIEVAANGAPVAVDDFYATGFGDALNVNAAEGLLANDSDPDGDLFQVIAVGAAQFGVLDVFADGSFVYTPDSGASGTETILYTISDGFAVATATLTIEVEAEDDRPMILGTPGADVLRAPDGGAILDGLGGRDVLIGGNGPDVFVLGDGDKDVFRNFDAAEDRFDLTAWGVQGFGELGISDRGGFITIRDIASGNVAHGFASDGLDIAELSAANFIFAPLESLTVSGVSDRAESVYGRSGDDMILNDGGFNKLFGQGGADTFVIGNFRGGVIGDFSVAEGDVIDLSAWGVSGFEDLRISETESLITVRGDGRNAVRIETFEGLRAEDLTAESFLFADTLLTA